MSAALLAELELPADQIRAVRLVAGRIALNEGFDDELVEDVKLAVGEACARLVAEAGGRDIKVRFRRHSGTLSAEFPGFPPPPQLAVGIAEGSAVSASDSSIGWLILTTVAPESGLDGDTLRLAWPLPRAAEPHP